MPKDAPEKVRYPSLAAPGFGCVTVDGQRHTKDFFIRANGKLKPRDKALAKEAYGNAHIIGPAELEVVCKKGAKTLLIAAGYNGVVQLAPEARQWLRDRQIEVELCATPQAAKRYAEIPGPKAVLVHVTC